MYRILIFSLFSIFVNQTNAASPYIFTCKSDQVTLSLQSKLTYGSAANGWKHYWGLIDYQVQKNGRNLTGTVNTYIMWRKDPRPGYNAFYAGLLENSEFQQRKNGNTGGALGFGAIDIRDDIRPKTNIKAKWTLNRAPSELKDLFINPQDLECSVF